MGIFDDFFGGSSTSSQPSGGLFDSFFDEPSEPESSGSLFGSYAPPLSTFGTHSGYGGRPYLSQDDADKSRLMSGIVQDPDTGYVGTPSDLYDRYLAEGRNPASLLRRFRK